MSLAVMIEILLISNDLDFCIETAERLQVKNLVLYHAEDNNISRRKELYKKEEECYYSSCLSVPEDSEVLDL